MQIKLLMIQLCMYLFEQVQEKSFLHGPVSGWLIKVYKVDYLKK